MINIHSIDYHNKTCAPWISTEVFVQGCKQNCKNCFNQELREFKKMYMDPPHRLIRFLTKYVTYKSVTFSGGEPMLQAKELAKVAKKLKKRGFLILCYTGYTYETLLNDKDQAEFLKYIDILIDGPFIEEQKILTGEDFSFVGSSNQRVIDMNMTHNVDELTLLSLKQEFYYYVQIMETNNGFDYLTNKKRLLA